MRLFVAVDGRKKAEAAMPPGAKSKRAGDFALKRQPQVDSGLTVEAFGQHEIGTLIAVVSMRRHAVFCRTVEFAR